MERCADYATPICNVNEGDARKARGNGNLSCIAIYAAHKFPRQEMRLPVFASNK